MSSITTTTEAATFSDLSDAWIIVADRVSRGYRTDDWRWTIPEPDVNALRMARNVGKALTVQGRVGGRTVLYAKLASSQRLLAA